jgi:hypothetical protein
MDATVTVTLQNQKKHCIHFLFRVIKICEANFLIENFYELSNGCSFFYKPILFRSYLRNSIERKIYVIFNIIKSVKKMGRFLDSRYISIYDRFKKYCKFSRCLHNYVSGIVSRPELIEID